MKNISLYLDDFRKRITEEEKYKLYILKDKSNVNSISLFIMGNISQRPEFLTMGIIPTGLTFKIKKLHKPE